MHDPDALGACPDCHVVDGIGWRVCPTHRRTHGPRSTRTPEHVAACRAALEESRRRHPAAGPPA